jgi:membrane protein DedA with SNARE-associated domain
MLQWRPIAWLLPPKRYAAVQEKFARYGNRLMFLARFLPGMRTAVYITAGATQRVSFARFLLLDGLAALISVPIWVYAGYFGANRREWLMAWIHRGQRGLGVVGAIVVVIAIGLWWWRRRRSAV